MFCTYLMDPAADLMELNSLKVPAFSFKVLLRVSRSAMTFVSSALSLLLVWANCAANRRLPPSPAGGDRCLRREVALTSPVHRFAAALNRL